MNRAARRRGNLEQRRRDRGIRRRVRRVGALGVATTALLAGGTVAAAPPAPDTSPRPGAIKSGLFADTSRALETREGYVIRAWKYGEELRSIIPLGRALNTYEAIVSIAGEGDIEFKDPKNKPKVPIRSASITVGLTLACAATPQSLQVGGTLSNAVNASVTPSLSGTVGATAGGQGGSSGGQGNGSVNGSITPSISGTLGDTVTTSGTITGTIAPGTSKDFPIAKKSLTGRTGYVVTKETRIAMDSCLGGAQVRAYATATLSTDQGDSAITTYGKPLFIERDNPGPAKNPPKVKEDRNPAPVPAVASTAISAPAKNEPVNQAPATPKPGTKPAPAATPKAPAAPATRTVDGARG